MQFRAIDFNVSEEELQYCQSPIEKIERHFVIIPSTTSNVISTNDNQMFEIEMESQPPDFFSHLDVMNEWVSVSDTQNMCRDHQQQQQQSDGKDQIIDTDQSLATIHTAVSQKIIELWKCLNASTLHAIYKPIIWDLYQNLPTIMKDVTSVTIQENPLTLRTIYYMKYYDDRTYVLNVPVDYMIWVSIGIFIYNYFVWQTLTDQKFTIDTITQVAQNEMEKWESRDTVFSKYCRFILYDFISSHEFTDEHYNTLHSWINNIIKQIHEIAQNGMKRIIECKLNKNEAYIIENIMRQFREYVPNADMLYYVIRDDNESKHCHVKITNKNQCCIDMLLPLKFDVMIQSLVWIYNTSLYYKSKLYICPNTNPIEIFQNGVNNIVYDNYNGKLQDYPKYLATQ